MPQPPVERRHHSPTSIHELVPISIHRLQAENFTPPLLKQNLYPFFGFNTKLIVSKMKNAYLCTRITAPVQFFKDQTKAYRRNEQQQKTRYSDDELQEFKELIEEKLVAARRQLDYYLNQMVDMADNPDIKIKSLDDGVGTVESERLNSMASRQRKHIQHLENALVRIQNKVYGVCRETGKLISKERLRAVPHATLSIEAKQSRKKVS
jgi:RNA polymerase-binding transcription factor DksA